MYVEVEPSGCCEYKGMVQVRFCMYLDKGDIGYERKYLEVPVIPKKGYTGKVGDGNLPLDQEHYEKWRASLPTEWINTPFHNHFIYVEPEASNEHIMDIGEAILKEAYAQWAAGQEIDIKNPAGKFAATLIIQRQPGIAEKIQSLKSTVLERKY